ncbi:MAG: hypothetical protein DMG13_23855 [Acidobacteria bacterium]|nr:MAG: hypothetical protein DMG13_23855 [Acidobacteriota bacterium]
MELHAGAYDLATTCPDDVMIRHWRRRLLAGLHGFLKMQVIRHAPDNRTTTWSLRSICPLAIRLERGKITISEHCISKWILISLLISPITGKAVHN